MLIKNRGEEILGFIGVFLRMIFNNKKLYYYRTSFIVDLIVSAAGYPKMADYRLLNLVRKTEIELQNEMEKALSHSEN